MDSKCLESFLIPEYEIATEGIGSAITNLVKNLWKIITNAISIIIKCFKGLFAKLKRSKGNKNNANNKASNNDSASNNQNNQRNNKSAEDELNQIHAEFDKMHDEAQKDIEERKKKLEEHKQKFAESHAQRQAELNEAINRMNKTVYRKNEDDNDKSGSEIARDIITAIRYIERTTLHANRYMMSIHTAHTKDDIYDNSPDNGDIRELIDNINIMQNTIDLYDLADDKLTDSNKDEICNRLQSATRKLEETKAKFDKDQSKTMDKLSRTFNIDDPNISPNTKKNREFMYRSINRQLKNIQTELIAAQKLAVSLTKII